MAFTQADSSLKSFQGASALTANTIGSRTMRPAHLRSASVSGGDFHAPIIALSGRIYLLYLLGYNVSVAVWVGFIALFGTAVQTAVVMVIYLEEAVARKREILGGRMTRVALLEAVTEGALLRLSPKVMTVSTIVASLLPIMWSDSTGAEVMKPVATPVLGGMVSSLAHVLRAGAVAAPGVAAGVAARIAAARHWSSRSGSGADRQRQRQRRTDPPQRGQFGRGPPSFIRSSAVIPAAWSPARLPRARSRRWPCRPVGQRPRPQGQRAGGRDRPHECQPSWVRSSLPGRRLP